MIDQMEHEYNMMEKETQDIKMDIEIMKEPNIRPSLLNQGIDDGYSIMPSFRTPTFTRFGRERNYHNDRAIENDQHIHEQNEHSEHHGNSERFQN